ncbi:FAR1 DNA binding domain, partial [Dillenia turbinata]
KGTEKTSKRQRFAPADFASQFNLWVSQIRTLKQREIKQSEQLKGKEAKDQSQQEDSTKRNIPALHMLMVKHCLVAVETHSPTDDSRERRESPAGQVFYMPEKDKNGEEPYEGMQFDSEEAAKAFYDKYARKMGFETRVLSSRRSERDGSMISRGLGCRGGPDAQKADGVQIQKRDRRRDGCTAMFLLKREKPGQWIVRKLVREHNHALVVSFRKTRPALDEKDKKIQELTTELRVKKRLSAAYRDQLLTFIKDVEDHNEHIAAKLQVVTENLKELEAKREELLQR